MPLSEEELRLLEQMERALVAEDPKLASTMRGTTLRATARRRALIAGGVFVVGVVVLMTGAVTQQTVVGIIGFVVMLGSAYVALSSWRGQTTAPEPGRTEPPPAPELQRHRRWPQQEAQPRRAQPADLAALDDGALRGALAPPPRPERRLLTRPTPDDQQTTRTGPGRRVRLLLCRACGQSARSTPGCPSTRARCRTRRRRAPGQDSTEAGSHAARDRRSRPAPAPSAATQASTSARTCGVGGRTGRQAAGVAGPLEQADQPVQGRGGVRVHVAPAPPPGERVVGLARVAEGPHQPAGGGPQRHVVVPGHAEVDGAVADLRPGRLDPVRHRPVAGSGGGGGPGPQRARGERQGQQGQQHPEPAQDQRVPERRAGSPGGGARWCRWWSCRPG